MGSQQFVKSIKVRYLPEKLPGEIPRQKSAAKAVDPAAILRQASGALGCSLERFKASGKVSAIDYHGKRLKKAPEMKKRTLPESHRPVIKGSRTPVSSPISNLMVWGGLVIVVVTVAVLRCQYLHVPLERDEGEYAYGGQLFLQGVPPFLLLYNMKLPGTQAVYALAMALFGQTISGIRIGLLLVNAATTFLVFCLGRRILGSLAGIAAAAVFAILSVGTSFLGPFGHATHFVLLPAVGGLILLDEALASRKAWIFLIAGGCLGSAVLMKQPGVVFAFFALYWWGWTRFTCEKQRFADQWNECAALLFGMLLPCILIAAWMALAGVFSRFWFWIFNYAWSYSGQVPFIAGLHILSKQMISHVAQAPAAWALAGLGLIFLATDSQSRSWAPFVLAFLSFSFLGVCPGLYFREHYFILMLPAVGLLSGVGFEKLVRWLFKPTILRYAAPLVLLALVFIQPIYTQRAILFSQDPYLIARKIYGLNPFPESMEVAKYIHEHSAPEDTVAVFGSEPQIYFYSQRRSATGYIYTYSLMENQPFARKMQEEMAQEVERARPKFIVFVNIITSWLRNEASEGWIFGWVQQFLNQNYEIVGLAEIFSREGTQYRWGVQAASSPIRSPFSLVVFRRLEKN